MVRVSLFQSEDFSFSFSSHRVVCGFVSPTVQLLGKKTYCRHFLLCLDMQSSACQLWWSHYLHWGGESLFLDVCMCVFVSYRVGNQILIFARLNSCGANPAPITCRPVETVFCFLCDLGKLVKHLLFYCSYMTISHINVLLKESHFIICFSL